MKKGRWVLASLIVTMGMLTACGDDATVSETEPDNQPANEEHASAEADNQPDESNSKESNEADEENGQNEENESANNDGEPEFGTRQNPVAHGVTAHVVEESFMGDAEYEMAILESVSGEEALETVKDANPFNEEPGEGKEYILAKFRVQLIEAEEEPFNVNSQQFDVISEGGSSYEDFVSVSGLEPSFRSDLYEGGETEGWVAFVVDADDERPLAKYGDVWFDLRGDGD